jgi:hypothetical protein
MFDTAALMDVSLDAARSWLNCFKPMIEDLMERSGGCQI